MKHHLPLLFALTCLAPLPAAARMLEWPIWREGAHGASLPAYRGDRLTIRLTPGAAAIARGHAANHPARALGVTGIDRALVALGASVRPEFRGETAPPPGSNATDFTAFYLVDLPPGTDLSAALDRLSGVAEIAQADPIGVTGVSAVANDSLWSDSWHLYQPSRIDIHAPEAWDVTRGDDSVVVAIIDTGVIPYHPDIGGSTPGSMGQIWTNRAEARGVPGVDDDGNGFVDDVWGWDFVNLPDSTGISPAEDWRDEDNDPNDYVGHGTSVAGLIGAITNNGIGVSGTVWNAHLMPLRVGWSTRMQQTGVVDLSYVAQAIRYATRMGARVINISLSTTYSSAIDAAVQDALTSGVSVVVAAGNNGSPHGISDFPSLINVTATDRYDVIPTWANVGSYVDLAAPGAAIPTTSLRRTGADSLGMRQPSYVLDANGTSFAAPIVSGAAALVQAARRARGQPPLEPALLRLSLMGACDDISAANPGASPIYWGAGRLNIGKAMTSSGGIRVTQLPGMAIGSAVDYTRWNGRRALAIPTLANRIEFVDEATSDVFRAVDLGSPPEGDLAAGDLGGGRGLAFFAALLDHRIAGIGGGGAWLPGWPVLINDGTPSPPVVGDLDGDGLLDVVVVVTDVYGYEWVEAFNSMGVRRTGFPVPLGRSAGTRPALADIDGSPGLEIVLQDADLWVYVLRSDGRSVPGWPIQLFGARRNSPVVTRWNGAPLVVVTAPGNWYGIGVDGRILIQRDLVSPVPSIDPVLADIGADGVDDVLISSDKSLYAWFLGTTSNGWPVSSGSATFTGSPVVGHLTSGSGPEILQTTTSTPVVLRLDGTVASDFPARVPLRDVTLVAPLQGTRTLLGAPYQSGYLLFDLAEGSWSDASQPWPTSRGNFARTGCRTGAPPMSAADEQGPDLVSDLRAETVDATHLRLTWHAPSDVGPLGRASAYDLRHSSTPIDEAGFTLLARNATQLPGTAGQPETLLVAIPPGALQYFRLRAVDGSGNWSATSNSAAGGKPPAEPDPVSIVTVTAARETTIDLRWIATGEDGWVGRAAGYEIAASPLTLTTGEFTRTPFFFTSPARADAGAPESTTVGPLPPDTHYWVSVRAVDAQGLRSALSTPIEATTQPIGSHVADLDPPQQVVDLRAEATSLNATRIVWAAPADDAPIGRAVAYDLRQAVIPMTADQFSSASAIPTPAWPRVAGAPETVWVQTPASGKRWYALRSTDAAGHLSPMSNVFALTAPATPPDRIVDLHATSSSDTSVSLAWSATGEDGRTGVPESYDVRVAESPLNETSFEQATHRLTLAATAQPGAPESTSVRLPRLGHWWFGVKAKDHFGILSALSNVVDAQTTTTPPTAPSFSLQLAVNPARPPVRFQWSAGSDPQARPLLVIHDLGGRRVRALALTGASGFAIWDGTDASGHHVPAGLYFAAFTTRSRRTVARVVLLP